HSKIGRAAAQVNRARIFIHFERVDRTPLGFSGERFKLKAAVFLLKIYARAEFIGWKFARIFEFGRAEKILRSAYLGIFNVGTMHTLETGDLPDQIVSGS